MLIYACMVASRPHHETGGTLAAAARDLVARGRVFVAADERQATIDRRLGVLGLTPGLEARDAYREVLLTAPALAEAASGVILSDEAARQAASGGAPFPELLSEAGLLWGIRADTAIVRLARCRGETITEGLDGLGRRLAAARRSGASFTRWKAVYAVGAGRPSRTALAANAHALARFAACAQEEGMVPVLSAKVLRGGDYSLERCYGVTKAVLRTIIQELILHEVDLTAVVVAPTMVTAGSASVKPAAVPQAAEATRRCLLRTVPQPVAGIAFSAAGQPSWDAAAHLNDLAAGQRLCWPLTLSTGTALQEAVLRAWAGRQERVTMVHDAVAHRLRCHQAAVQGRWSSEMDAA